MSLRTLGEFCFCLLLLLTASASAQTYHAGTIKQSESALSEVFSQESQSLPPWTTPNKEDAEQLSEVARTLAPGIILVGHPDGGFGTAWVISKKHRLLATNAHVADILFNTKEMLAIQNGNTKTGKVTRVWYHPGVARYVATQGGVVVRSTDPSLGPVNPQSPDVAVLELDETLELSTEFPLATEQEIENLLGTPGAIFGFPGHDTTQWPPPGERALATFHSGVVSRVTDFELRGADNNRSQMLQYTMASWPGFSGSPVMLPNGHVIALHNMSRTALGRGDRVQSMAHGVRIDCLWELLVHHQLADRVAAEINPSKLDIERWLKPDPEEERTQRVLAFVKKARNLQSRGEYANAVQECDNALQIRPTCAEALYERALAKYILTFQEAKRMSPDHIIDDYNSVLRDTIAYCRLQPNDMNGLTLHICAHGALAQHGSPRFSDLKACRVLKAIQELADSESFKQHPVELQVYWLKRIAIAGVHLSKYSRLHARSIAYKCTRIDRFNPDNWELFGSIERLLPNYSYQQRAEAAFKEAKRLRELQKNK